MLDKGCLVFLKTIQCKLLKIKKCFLTYQLFHSTDVKKIKKLKEWFYLVILNPCRKLSQDLKIESLPSPLNNHGIFVFLIIQKNYVNACWKCFYAIIFIILLFQYFMHSIIIFLYVQLWVQLSKDYYKTELKLNQSTLL